jgi:sugar lactone lactonase YvrE
MCMDDEGGVWSARWQNGTVIRITPEGVLDVVIEFPSAWHMTCCVFGGV